MQAGFDEGVRQCRGGCGRGLNKRRADIAKNGRVDAVRKTDVAEVGVSANPVVVNVLVRRQLLQGSTT